MEKLGVELPLLITQIINFVIMIFVLTKLLYKPILKGLEKRRQKIEEGLKLTETVKIEEEHLQKRREEMVKEARIEARAILEEAKKAAKDASDEIINQGKQEVQTLKLKMENELNVRHSEMVKKLTLTTVTTATEMVKKLLPKLLNDKTQHDLVMTQLELMEKQHET